MNIEAARSQIDDLNLRTNILKPNSPQFRHAMEKLTETVISKDGVTLNLITVFYDSLNCDFKNYGIFIKSDNPFEWLTEYSAHRILEDYNETLHSGRGLWENDILIKALTVQKLLDIKYWKFNPTVSLLGYHVEAGRESGYLDISSSKALVNVDMGVKNYLGEPIFRLAKLDQLFKDCARMFEYQLLSNKAYDFAGDGFQKLGTDFGLGRYGLYPVYYQSPDN